MNESIRQSKNSPASLQRIKVNSNFNIWESSRTNHKEWHPVLRTDESSTGRRDRLKNDESHEEQSDSIIYIIISCAYVLRESYANVI